MKNQTTTLGGILLIAVARVLGALPLPIRRLLGYWGGWIFSKFPSREKRIAQLQFEYAFGYAAPSAFLSEVFSNIGIQSLEALNLLPFTKEGSPLVRCNDWPTIRELLASGKGIVALTAHTGNWDLVGAYMVSRGISVSTVARPARSPAVQQVLSFMRSRYGIDTIWRTGPTSARKILQVLKTQGVVAALIDQDTDVASAMVPFFGHPASTPSGIVDLGRRAGAIVCSVFSRRDPDGSILISVQPFDTQLSEAQVLQEFNERLEQWIRLVPSQWVWFHKRWRTLASGERLPTKRYLDHIALGLQGRDA